MFFTVFQMQSFCPSVAVVRRRSSVVVVRRRPSSFRRRASLSVVVVVVRRPSVVVVVRRPSVVVYRQGRLFLMTPVKGQHLRRRPRRRPVGPGNN